MFFDFLFCLYTSLPCIQDNSQTLSCQCRFFDRLFPVLLCIFHNVFPNFPAVAPVSVLYTTFEKNADQARPDADLFGEFPAESYFMDTSSVPELSNCSDYNRRANCCLNGFAFKLPVIANQSADWCGNPPVERNQVTITAKNRSNSHSSGFCSVHFPSIRGIATPVCALARNDSKKRTNNNLSFCHTGHAWVFQNTITPFSMGRSPLSSKGHSSGSDSTTRFGFRRASSR